MRRAAKVALGAAVGLGVVAVAGAAMVLLWPQPLVRWYAGRHPEVLFFGATREKVVALTIDDAPHPAVTPAILDVLRANGARATFFVIGDNVPGNEDILRRIHAEGHEAGNHTLRDVASRSLDSATFERELRRTHEVLAPFGAVRWFRPGSGRFHARMLRQAERAGYRCALGSVYPFDPQIRSSRFAAWYVLRHARPGSVVILHDGSADRARTVDVLRRVLPVLRARGYRVVTLSELTAMEAAEREA